MGDTCEEIANDVAAVGRIEAVPTLLGVLCDITGMRFAAVARVSGGTWTACEVHDAIGFGLERGGQLDLDSTLCKEVRETRTPIVIEHASRDPVYRTHHTPRIYAIESYVSVPIILPDDDYFGNLCAIDPSPAKLNDSGILSMFTRFAALIAMQLHGERRRMALQTALLDERSAAGLREQLVAILGHDVRVPLGAIAMGCQRLQARSMDPRIDDAVREIRSGATRIAALVDDALDLARARLGGVMDIQLAEIDRIDEDLFGVVSDMQDAHPGRNIEWSFDFHGVVRVDRARVQQLAASLLKNALTHGSPRGAVRLTAGSDGATFTLTVWNEGEPMSPLNGATSFAPVWHSADPAHETRLGLGLHICAQIVKAHQGQITVTSSASAGTTFAVELPQATTASPTQAALAIL